jgi:hypothetical protein
VPVLTVAPAGHDVHPAVRFNQFDGFADFHEINGGASWMAGSSPAMTKESKPGDEDKKKPAIQVGFSRLVFLFGDIG